MVLRFTFSCCSVLHTVLRIAALRLRHHNHLRNRHRRRRCRVSAAAPAAPAANTTAAATDPTTATTSTTSTTSTTLTTTSATPALPLPLLSPTPLPQSLSPSSRWPSSSLSVSYHDLRHRLLLLLFPLLLFLLLLPRPPRPPPHRRSITIIASFVILQRIFKNLMILTRATATSCVFFVLWSPRSLGASVGPREGQGSICQPLCSESAGSVLSCRALKAPRKVRSGLHNPELT